MSIGPVDFSTLALCLAVVILWSVLRPASIRDYDGRHLPNNPISRLLYTLICAFAYISLVAAFAIAGPALVDATRHSVPVVPFIEAYKDKAPVLGLVLLGTAMQFNFFRDIDRSTLIWLHSARHLFRDGQELIEHLRKCRFTPGVGEDQHNRELASRFGIQLEPEDVTIGLSDAMQRWSKVETLTRLVREWNKSELTRALNSSEMADLENVERAHERKTQIITEIIHLIEDTYRGTITPELLKNAVRAIGNAETLDQLSHEELSVRLKSIFSDVGRHDPKRPLSKTLSDLKYDLSKIAAYFKEEYNLLLETISGLAARSVVLSGDAAPRRLDSLKEAGFGGLGKLEVISFDRVLWLFISVAFFGFIILAAGSIGGTRPEQAEGLARFAFIMAIATLIGSIVGSHRRHARAEETPWATYIAAGCAAGLVMLFVNYGVVIFKSAIGLTVYENQRKLDLAHLLPWTLLPIFVTIAVCRLGRLSRWPIPISSPSASDVAQRCADGIAISIVLLIAFLGAYYFHLVFGIDLPKGLQDRMASLPDRLMPVPIFWPLQLLGFLIGAVAVQDVRRAAHTRVVDQQSSTVTSFDPWKEKLGTSLHAR